MTIVKKLQQRQRQTNDKKTLFIISQFVLESPASKNREERSLYGCGILSLSSSVCPAGSGEQSEDSIVGMGYSASIAEDALSGGAAERAGMVEVPVGFTDRTAGFLTVDACFFKSGHGNRDSPAL